MAAHPHTYTPTPYPPQTSQFQELTAKNPRPPCHMCVHHWWTTSFGPHKVLHSPQEEASFFLFRGEGVGRIVLLVREGRKESFALLRKTILTHSSPQSDQVSNHDLSVVPLHPLQYTCTHVVKTYCAILHMYMCTHTARFSAKRGSA